MTEQNQEYLFDDVRDARLESAELLLKKALLEAEGANDDKKRYTKIYKTKERQLHYAQVKALIEKARAQSLAKEDQCFVAIDALNAMGVIDSSETWDYLSQGAVIYAAFEGGREVEINELVGSRR